MAIKDRKNRKNARGIQEDGKRIIDAKGLHTHCFPDKIAGRALDKLSQSAGELEYYTDGTIGGLKKAMKSQGVTSSVVLNIATNEKQHKSVNDFSAMINNEEDIFTFGSVCPFSKDALDELERIKELGLKGVKLHPEYQDFFVDDERLKPVYEKISELGLITVFHSGKDLAYKPPYKCSPERLLKALKWLSAPVVAAHWGASGLSDDVIKYLCGTDVYLATAFGFGYVTKDEANRIIDAHGTDKILFGTDSPWSYPEREIDFINTLDLSENDKNKIFYENGKNLLKIK